MPGLTEPPDLSAIAVRAGFQSDRMPFGIMPITPAFADESLRSQGFIKGEGRA